MIGAHLLPHKTRDGEITAETTHVWIVENYWLKRLELQGILKGGALSHPQVLADGKLYGYTAVYVTEAAAVEEAKRVAEGAIGYHTRRLEEAHDLNLLADKLRRECAAAQAGTIDPLNPLPSADVAVVK